MVMIFLKPTPQRFQRILAAFLLFTSVSSLSAAPENAVQWQSDDLLRLPPAALESLQTLVIDRGHGAERRLELLMDLLFAEDGLALQYSAQPTLSAAEAFAAGHGNCLSFTLLFLALAEAAGIEAQARELRLAADWRRDGDALFETGHINVEVRTERRRLIVDFSPRPVELSSNAVQSARLISAERVKAHFFNNRAAELIVAGDIVAARQMNEQALALAPDLISALNNRGVIEARLGQHDLAEDFYQRARILEPDNVNALFNLLNLHQRNDRHEKAAVIRARLETLSPRDPYFQWALGRQFEADGNYRQALDFFQRAVRLQPADPLLHLSLANAANALELNPRAQRALGQARELMATDQDE